MSQEAETGGSTSEDPVLATVAGMWFRRRGRSAAQTSDAFAASSVRIIDDADCEPTPRAAVPIDANGAPGGGDGTERAGDNLPAVRAERALLALAVHAQQLDHRLARIEARLEASDAEAAARVEAHALEVATHDELLEVRLHSARVAAELARVSVNMQARFDDLAVEHRRHRRTDVFAESILDLSDRLYDREVDLRGAGEDRAAS
jgi:hypothetical protein